MLDSIGDRIRGLRCLRGLSQEALAKAASVSNMTISRYERGVIIDPHSATLKRIADVLGATTDWLLTGKGDGPDVHAHRVTEAAAVREVAAR